MMKLYFFIPNQVVLQNELNSFSESKFNEKALEIAKKYNLPTEFEPITF